MRKASANYDELCAIIDGGLAALVEWDRKWLDMMGTLLCRLVLLFASFH